MSPPNTVRGGDVGGVGDPGGVWWVRVWVCDRPLRARLRETSWGTSWAELAGSVRSVRGRSRSALLADCRCSHSLSPSAVLRLICLLFYYNVLSLILGLIVYLVFNSLSYSCSSHFILILMHCNGLTPYFIVPRNVIALHALHFCCNWQQINLFISKTHSNTTLYTLQMIDYF